MADIKICYHRCTHRFVPKKPDRKKMGMYIVVITIRICITLSIWLATSDGSLSYLRIEQIV